MSGLEALIDFVSRDGIPEQTFLLLKCIENEEIMAYVTLMDEFAAESSEIPNHKPQIKDKFQWFITGG